MNSFLVRTVVASILAIGGLSDGVKSLIKQSQGAATETLSAAGTCNGSGATCGTHAAEPSGGQGGATCAGHLHQNNTHKHV